MQSRVRIIRVPLLGIRIFLIILLSLIYVHQVYAGTNGYTQEGAVNYARGLVGTKWDVDGTGYDCVDIVKKYFADIGGLDPQYGHAGAYASETAIPSGWQRMYMSNGYSPQLGDVAVWDFGAYQWDVKLLWGHVGVVVEVNGNTITLVDQDTTTQRAADYSKYRASDVTCYIHPDFGPAPDNLGDSFYAFVRNQTSDKYWTNINDNVVGSDLTHDGRQLWHFIRQSDGSYIIQNGYNLTVMDVDSLSGQLGANVYLNGSYTGNSNQRFYIYFNNNAYYFAPAYGGYHLDMSQATFNLEIWGDGFDGGPQAFSIEKVNPVDIGNNIIAKIKNPSSGKYITNVSGNLVGRDASGGGDQIWTFLRQSDGSYYIRSASDLAIWDVDSLQGTVGANVYLNGTITGNQNQKFYIYSVGGAYYFAPTYGGYHVDMSQSSFNVEIWGDGFSGGAQAFALETINPVDIGNSITAKIKNPSSGKYITNVSGNLVGRDASGGGDQIWTFLRQSDGSYYIRSASDLAIWDVDSLQGTVGANVYLNGTITGNQNQKFYIYSVGGAYYFAPTYGGYHVDMSQSSFNVEIWGDGFSGGAQAFALETINPVDIADFVTPGALKTIAAETFYGIGAKNVRINDGVTFLGRKAFANCQNLKSIYIPDSVTDIANDLLSGCGNVTVYGKSGSEAEEYATNNGFAFIAIQ